MRSFFLILFSSRTFVALTFFAVLFFDCIAQKQLVVLRNGIVVARYSVGGRFKCVLKNHQRKEGLIVALSDFSMIIANDTIAFKSIARIDRKGYFRVNIMRDVGYILLIGGLIYFTADQINNALGYDKSNFDQSDINALIIAGLGAAMLFIKSPYRHIGNRMIMRTVDFTSPYYLPVEK